MNHPKRKSTMDQNDESNSAPTSSKHRRQHKSNESSDIAGGSKISTEQSGRIEKSTPIQIENLPTEILIKIIESLPMAQWSALERVHPNIRDVVHTAWGSLKKIDIQRDLLPRQPMKSEGESNVQKKKRIDILKKLVERAPELVDIAVGCSSIARISDIMAQLVRFEKLHRIDFGENCLTTSSLSRFLRESASRGQLKEIVNIYASLRPAHFNNDHLSVAFDNSKNNNQPLRLETMDFESRNVRRVEIRWNFLALVDVSRLTTFRVLEMHVPLQLLADLLDRSPQLRQLSFEFSCQYTHDGDLHQPAANAVETVLEANKRIISAIARMDALESLIMGSSINAYGCECGNFDQQLQLTELLTTLGHRPSFKELGLVSQLTRPGFMYHLAAAIPNVESLRLEIGDLTTPMLNDIFQQRLGLRILHVFTFPYSGVDMFNFFNHVIKNAPTLESLVLEFPSIMFSRQHLKALGDLKELRELNLDSMDENMDDAVLEAWADGFGANLTKLEMSNCGPHITGDAIVKLIEKSPNLNTLIVGNYSISDHTVERMTALSPRIEEFGFDCEKITTIGLQHVVDGFRQLSQLHLKKEQLTEKLNLNIDKYRVVNLVQGFYQ